MGFYNRERSLGSLINDYIVSLFMGIAHPKLYYVGRKVSFFSVGAL